MITKRKKALYMDDLFDIVEDETLSLDDSNNDDKNKEETKEEKNDTKPKKSMLEKYGENLTTKVYVTNPAIAREEEIEKTILTILFGIVGALALGIGMCFTMVWDRMVLGIIIGLIGILILLSLIPLTKGIKD